MYENNPALEIVATAKLVKRNRQHLKVLRAFEKTANGTCLHFGHIVVESDMDLQKVRKIVRHLKRKGMVTLHHGLWTEDGDFGGSGHMITTRGRTILKLLSEVKDE